MRRAKENPGARPGLQSLIAVIAVRLLLSNRLDRQSVFRTQRPARVTSTAASFVP